MEIPNNERGVLNIDVVLAAKEVAAPIKLLAMRAKSGDYIVPGKYFQELNDFDLAQLVNLADMCNFNEMALFNMVCLTEILSSFEGFPALSDQEARDNVGMIVIVLTSMMLARKGLCKVHYDNISFSGSADNDTIVELIQ